MKVPWFTVTEYGVPVALFQGAPDGSTVTVALVPGATPGSTGTETTKTGRLGS